MAEKKKRMTAASRKAKGRRLQQWACRYISKLTGFKVGTDEHIASREMGQSGTDVRLIGEAKRLFPFSVECKNQETWSVHNWIKQAQSNKDPDTDWLLICNKNRGNAVVIIDAKVFFRIISIAMKWTKYSGINLK